MLARCTLLPPTNRPVTEACQGQAVSVGRLGVYDRLLLYGNPPFWQIRDGQTNRNIVLTR